MIRSHPLLSGGGEGHVAKGKNDPAVGDPVKIGHLFGDGQRGPAVAGGQDFDLDA